MTSVISNFIRNQANDPDENRRANLLNIMLLGVTGINIIILALLLVTQFSVEANILPIGIGTLAIVGITYFINQKISGPIASALFLVLLTIIISVSDLPEEIIGGRSLFLFTIPILLASVLLKPHYAFVMTFFVGIVINVIAWRNGLEFQFLSPVSLFGVGLVAWLSAKSLDDALRELRLINLELDQRVENRTQALQTANIQLQEEIDVRIKIERELVVMRDQAVSANNFKSELLARVSHELRTPLGAILGYLEMLRAKIYGSLELQQEETINTIIELNQDLTRLVNELLEQARLDSAEVKLENEMFSPYQLTESIYNRLSILADNKGIKFNWVYDQNLPDQLCGDMQHLRQIFINLVGNALKFTEDGFVELKVVNVDDLNWGIVVADSGIGIPEKDIERIFEGFQQVDHTYTRSRGGFGLGLSIVKHLVSLMNGKISVESEFGKGSKFMVHLPKNLKEAVR
ncbi:MAG: ATP-binding protein [Chloroflexota bacterium]